MESDISDAVGQERLQLVLAAFQCICAASALSYSRNCAVASSRYAGGNFGDSRACLCVTTALSSLPDLKYASARTVRYVGCSTSRATACSISATAFSGLQYAGSGQST